jgi:catechol 2,3-dioxygenase-like lactoylglutathione lyase family enzyme
LSDPDTSKISKARDIAFVRFQVPDLGRLQTFAEQFGLLSVARTPDKLYMTGTHAPAFIYMATHGEPRFDGVAFELGSSDDLSVFGRMCNAPVEPLDGPVNGQRVRLLDPDGFSIEAVVFDERATTGPDPATPDIPTNDGVAKKRWNQEKQQAPGPSEVCRLGHVVLNVKDYDRSQRWYKERFGFITSDEITAENGSPVGAFMRCDRGSEFTDHHTLFLMQAPEVGFNHAAFEVRNFDSLMAGHDHLASSGHQHRWGIGRHILGSQIFDYWRDPWGHVLEHWTDGDLMNADWGSRRTPISQLRAVQWGHVAPHGPATGKTTDNHEDTQ